MTWQNSQNLIFALGCLIFVPLGWWLLKLNLKRITAFIPENFWPDLMPDFDHGRGFVIHFFLAMSLVCLAIALARPMYGEVQEDIEIEGTDIVVALDLSNSMYSEDVSPSRLSRAKLFIEGLIEGLGQDRMAIVGFAESAHVAVPFTSDSTYLKDMMRVLDPGVVSHQGTNLQNAIKVAEESFQRIGNQENEHKAIILISDGEDFSRSKLETTSPLYVVGVGTEEGGPITLRDSSGNNIGYKKDSSGKVILTKLNRKALQEVAELSGGKYYDLSSPDVIALSILRNMTRNKLNRQQEKVVNKVERFQWPLFASLFFLLASFIYPRQKPRGSRFNLKNSSLLWVLVLGTTVSKGVNAKPAEDIGEFVQQRKAKKFIEEKDYGSAAELLKKSISNPDGQDRYNQATLQSLTDEKDAALKALESSSAKAIEEGDWETAAFSEYNRAATLLEQKKTNEALQVASEVIEIAKQIGNEKLAEDARKLFKKSANQKKNEKSDSNQEKNQDKDQDKKQEPDDKEQDNQKEQESDDSQSTGKKSEYQSKSISRETAESIMRELSEHEVNTQKRMIRGGGKNKGNQSNGKDW